MLKDDGKISKIEFQELLALAKSDPELANFATTENLEKLVLEVAQKACSGKRSKIPCTPEIDHGDPKKESQQSVYHVFLENSLSMDGYLNGNTDLRDAAMALMTKMKRKEEPVRLYYINKESHPVSGIIPDFVEFLKPQNVAQFGIEGRKNSEINNVLRIVADTACKSEERICVVISDYIYSINGKKVKDELDFQKHTTELSLQPLAKKDYAILIIKIDSKFKGLYYPMQGKGLPIDEQRPVYMWMMGEKKRILEFPQKYRIDELTGYDKHLILLNEQAEDIPFYTILSSTERQGSFDKADRGATVYTSIKDVKPNREGILQFAIAVDLSSCPADTQFLVTKENYRLKSDAGDDFEVVSVTPIEKVDLNHNDKDQKGTATHIIVISANSKLSKGSQKLVLSLKKGIPTWVKEASTDSDLDDTGRVGKTFGLWHLIQGASAAFDYNSESLYYSFPIIINN